MKKIAILFLALLLLFQSIPCALAASYGVAVIDGRDADRVHLRASPAASSASYGLYFTGTEVSCLSDPSQTWVRVQIGAQTGYMMSKYLTDGTVSSRQPGAVVSASGGVNFRSAPSTEAALIATLPKGDALTILGETADHWYYAWHGGQLGYVNSAFVTLGQPAPGVPADPRNVTVTSDPKDSLMAYVMASNCYVILQPTDASAVTCQYDANAVRFADSVERGTHILTLTGTNASGSAYSTATLYLPRSLYYSITLDVKSGEGAMAGGFQCYAGIQGDHARFSLTLKEDNAFGYSISLTDSVCVLGIVETVKDFSIAADGIADSRLIVPAYDMPAYVPGSAAYSYVRGTGTPEIKVSFLKNSELDIGYSKW